MSEAMQTALIMATDRPTSAKDRKAHMEAVAARLEAEEKARLQEHRRACNLPEPSEGEEGSKGLQENFCSVEDTAGTDSEALLQFEAEVAVSAGRHLVVAAEKTYV